MKYQHNPSGHQIQPTGRRWARPRHTEPKPPMTAAEIHALKLRQRGIQPGDVS